MTVCFPCLGWGFPDVGRLFHNLNERWANGRSRQHARGPLRMPTRPVPLSPRSCRLSSLCSRNCMWPACEMFHILADREIGFKSIKSDLPETLSFSLVFKVEIIQVSVVSCFCPKTLKSHARVSLAGRAAPGDGRASGPPGLIRAGGRVRGSGQCVAVVTGEKQSLDRGHLPEGEVAGQGRAAGPRPAVSGPRGREGSTWQFRFPQEAACSRLPSSQLCSLPCSFERQPPPGEPPRWGQPLELQTRKPGSRGQGQAESLVRPPGPQRLEQGATHLGAVNWNDTVMTCSFLPPALEYRVPTLGLENAVVVEGWNSVCPCIRLSRPPEKQEGRGEGCAHGASRGGSQPRGRDAASLWGQQ